MTLAIESKWWQRFRAFRGAQAFEASQHIGATLQSYMHIKDSALRSRQITTGNLAGRIKCFVTNSAGATTAEQLFVHSLRL